MVSSLSMFVARGLGLPVKDRRLVKAGEPHTQRQTLVVGKEGSEGPAVLTDEGSIQTAVTEEEPSHVEE